MKEFFTIALLLISCAVCFAFAGYLAVHGLEGWGWFLFIGLLVSGVSYKAGGKASSGK
jgi:hypothetical protein